MIADSQMLVLLLAPGATAAAATRFLEQLANLQTLPVAPATGTVRGDWNLRQGPGTTWPVVGAAAQGQLLELWGQDGEWRLVRDVAGSWAGWLHAKALE
jgi:uncharacterized protein YraI